METEISSTFTPPYNIPFRTFLNLLQRMEQDGGTPPRIDRSYLHTMSGQAQTYTMSALRSFGLIEDDGSVTPELDDLVLKPQDRPRLIGDLLHKYYGAAVAHGEMHGTPQQLEEVFAELNVSGDTLRKAMSFYLHAARFANIPISRYMKLRAAPRRTSGGQRKASAAPARPPVVAGNASARRRQNHQQGPLSDLRKTYIEKLMEKALADGTPDTELLDRVERLLGYATENEPAQTEDESEKE